MMTDKQVKPNTTRSLVITSRQQKVTVHPVFGDEAWLHETKSPNITLNKMSNGSNIELKKMPNSKRQMQDSTR